MLNLIYLYEQTGISYINCSGVLRTPECGAELSLPTADLFGCALTRTPEQKSAGAKIVADFKLADWARSTFAQLRIVW